MKKILFGALALASAVSFTACDKTAGSGSATAADSLSTAYGNYVGSMLLSDFSQMENKTKADKEQFLRGMQLVFSADDSRNTMMGMQVALQINAELNQMEEQGVDVDRAAVMNAFKAAFLADSTDYASMSEASTQFRTIYDRAMQAAAEKKAAEKEQEPEAVQNKMIGEQYIADQQKENPNVKVTESGLAYVIEVPGVDPKPEANATVEVNYTGKLIDGTVFDSTDGRGPATFNLQGVVPGFREGIMLLGKGGKATLYIPGSLAYGVNGAPQAGIGPNQLLIFDVELLDIKE